MILVTLGFVLLCLLSLSRDDIPEIIPPAAALYVCELRGMSTVRILRTSSAMEKPGTAEYSHCSPTEFMPDREVELGDSDSIDPVNEGLRRRLMEDTDGFLR